MAFKPVGILYEPELHFIPRKYFDMAVELSKFMQENNIRELQGVVEAGHYRDMQYYLEDLEGE